MNTRTTLSITILALAASTGQAAITGVTGNTNWLGSPPANCSIFQLFSANAFVWDEKQNVPLSLFTDMTNNPGVSSSPVPGNISGVYDSAFLHFDGSTGVLSAAGTITFSQPIVACIFKHTLLDLSDGPAGAPTTIYPTGFLNRGLGTSIPSFFSISGNTMTFNIGADPAFNEICQVRIITSPAPAPGSMALLGLGGLISLRRRR